MNTSFRLLTLVVALLVSLQPGRAQIAPTAAVVKTRNYNQGTSATATAAVTDPFTFRAMINLGALGSPQVMIPGGATRNLVLADSVYSFSQSFPSQAGMDAVYAVGDYTFTGSFSGIPLNAAVNLGAASYPPVPVIANITPLQSADTTGTITINWSAFSGADTGTDVIDIAVLEVGGALVERATVAATDTSYEVTNLQPGTTYNATIIFTHGTAQNTSDLPLPVAGFHSETRFRIQTAGGGAPDTTPPTLITAVPTNTATGVSLVFPVAFLFSEPMDTTKIAITWTNLDGAKFGYNWVDSKTLSCTYTGAAPGGTVITWVLNQNAAGANNFRDAAGNLLARTTGSFTTAPVFGGPCTNSSELEAAGFGIFKQTSHRQNDANAPVEDLSVGAQFQAFNRITNAAGVGAVEFPAPPAAPPHQLLFLSRVFSFELLTVPALDQAGLDSVMPPGTYAFQLRNPATNVVAATDLQLPAASYPAVPHFANYAAAQNIDTNLDFTLTWDAFAGATTNDSLQIEISDSGGNVIFSAPDACGGHPLPATATSVVLPKGLLPGRANLTATLIFFRTTDTGKTMPGTTAKGIAAQSRATRMNLHTQGIPPLAARIIAITRFSPTLTSLTITGSVNTPYVIESSPTVNFGWIPLSTNLTDGTGQSTFPFDPTPLAPRRFFRVLGR